MSIIKELGRKLGFNKRVEPTPIEPPFDGEAYVRSLDAANIIAPPPEEYGNVIRRLGDGLISISQPGVNQSEIIGAQMYFKNLPPLVQKEFLKDYYENEPYLPGEKKLTKKERAAARYPQSFNELSDSSKWEISKVVAEKLKKNWKGVIPSGRVYQPNQQIEPVSRFKPTAPKMDFLIAAENMSAQANARTIISVEPDVPVIPSSRVFLDTVKPKNETLTKAQLAREKYLKRTDQSNLPDFLKKK